MKYITLTLLIALVTGCASNQFYTSNHSTASSSNNFHNLNEELAYVGSLLEVGYEDPNQAIASFSEMGMDATYFSPKYRFFLNYPEVFILSKERSGQLIILFVGTDSAGDWIQNAKSTNYEDVAVEDTFYIPSGHAGFRRGMYNLIKNQFFTNHINKHIEKYNVKKSENELVKVTITGHSQGAGLAQFATPIIDGYKYKKGAITKEINWPYTVQAVYAFAPPYAVSHTKSDWDFMEKTYRDITYQVIRDNDFVPTVYNAAAHGHTVPVRHYGKLIRITRDDDVLEESTFWGSKISESHKNMPHHISGYQRALNKAAKKAKRMDAK